MHNMGRAISETDRMVGEAESAEHREFLEMLGGLLRGNNTPRWARQQEHEVGRAWGGTARLSTGLAGLGSRAAQALAGGERNENTLTDLIFFERHPERGGRSLRTDERDLVREWLQIRDTLVRSILRGTPPPPGEAGTAWRPPFGIRLPTGRRRLDPVLEEPKARAVYGGSLRYSDVWISDSLGANGRPWTTWTPLGCVMNLGPAAYQSPGSNISLLIHELAHCWQSQHHLSPVAFMANSVASQAAASTAGGSAYCYRPGKSFGSYAAEQIAQQVQNGEPGIVAHVASVPAGKIDGANVRSLALPRWETPGKPGVRC